MNELYTQAVHYANSLWRRRWIALSIAWVFCLIGWAIVAALPNTYVSSGRIYVDTANVLGPLLRGLLVENDVRSEVRLLQQTLLSRPNLERAVRMVDLDITADTPQQLEVLIDSVRDRTTLLSSVTEEDLFSVSFTDSDPRRARDLVQALITIFVESNLGESRSDLESARAFINDQLTEYERQLDIAEKRLAEFKLENAVLLPGQSTFLARTQEMREQLAYTKTQLAEAIAQRNVMRQELASIDELLEFGAQGGDGPPSDSAIRILQLNATLEELLSRYTEDHPDVKTVMRRLEALEAEENEFLLSLPIGSEEDAPEDLAGGPGYGIPNPVYAQTHAALVQRESDVKVLEERVRRLTEAVEQLSETAAQAPVVEAELARLNRDYDVIKSKYEQFLSRRETARIAQDRDNKADKVQFRIIDPPKVPSFPTGPNRPVLLTLVLFLGLGAGVGVAAVMVILDTTYSTASGLRDEFGLPVLGTVTSLKSMGHRLWGVSRVATTAVAALGIFATYGLLQLVEQNSGLNNAELLELSPGFINRTINFVQQTLAGVLPGVGL